MRPRSLDLLVSPLLLGSLALLLANDFLLKPALHNAFTGKLSDFAGLTAFALCGCAVFPGRRRLVVGAVALAWVGWKSPLADPLIAAWNALGPWQVQRVADPTDLLALLVLPLVQAYAPPPARRPRLRRALAPLVAGACLFAFAATSYIRRLDFPPDTRYEFAEPPDALVQAMHDLEVGVGHSLDPQAPLPGERFRIDVSPSDGAEPYDDVQITGELRESASGGTVLVLLHAYRMGPERIAADRLRAAFERQVVAPLRRREPNRVHGPPLTLGEHRYFRARLLDMPALTENRARVRVKLARTAYLALVEVTPQQRWHVIFPAADADDRRFDTGEHLLRTACPDSAAALIPPGVDVPVCGVTRRLTVAERREFGQRVTRRCPDGTSRETLRIAPGWLLLLATDAPLSRAELERFVRGRCMPGVSPLDAGPLGDALRQFGVRRWSVTEEVLRR